MIYLKPYQALFRIRFINSLQYRFAAFAGLLTQFAWGLMYVLAFLAFYRSNPANFPMSFSHTVTYIWLQQAFVALFFLWFYENSIFESIETGSIAYELARPVDLYGFWISLTAANRLSRTLLRAVPLIAIALFLPHPLRLIVPTELIRWGFFLLSMILALGVVISFSLLVYISAFYTINSSGVRLLVAIFADFLSGAYIPLPFFPGSIRTVAELLPFGSMQNMPLLIFSGYLQGTAILRGIGLQAMWLVILVVIGRLWMKRAISRVVVQGG